MKQLITPIVVFIALIAVFVVIDRNEFNLHDVVQSESSTTNRIPVVSAPVIKSVTDVKKLVTDVKKPVTDVKQTSETTSVEETKPVTEAKPTETKLLAETKPDMASEAEKTVETMPAETSHLQKQSPKKRPSPPLAVPVVTAEEAEELNKEALDYVKSLERKNDANILEGKIVAMSECPDPASIDYPDCNLIITTALNDVEHTKINLIVPCIRNSKKIIQPDIQPDSLIAFKLADESSLTEEDKEIQISDDDPDYELDYCYVEQIETIAYYSKISNYKGQQSNEIKYDTKLALTDKDIQRRKTFIESELERINKIISDYSEDDAKVFYDKFIVLTSDIGEKNHPYAEITCEDGFKKILPVEVNVTPKDFINHSFSTSSDRLSHNAEIIASVSDYLKQRGILLIVLSVPQHFEAYADRFNLSSKLSTYNICRLRFMKYLLEKDVEVLDCEPIVEKYLRAPFYFFQVLNKDLHPTEMGAYHIAQYLADHLKTYAFFESMKKDDYMAETKTEYIEVDYYGQKLRNVQTITLKGSHASPISKDSPFLLVGDSFSMTGAIQYHIANSLGTRINVINATSSFPNTARMLQMRRREISPNTKVCFLINSSNDIYRYFYPFVNNEIVLFPSNTFFPNQVFHFNRKEDSEEWLCEFDLDISNLVTSNSKYKLIFSVFSDSKPVIELKINSYKPLSISSSRTDQGYYQALFEYSLPDVAHPFHIRLTARPTKDIDKMNCNIEKILLVEE